MTSPRFQDPDLAAEWLKVLKKMTPAGVARDVSGSLGLGSRQTLYGIARSTGARRILELGTHVGMTALALALAAQSGGRVTTVDVLDVNAPGAAWATNGYGLPSPRDLAVRLGVADRIEFVTARAEDYLADCREEFDMVFLDAGHSPSDSYAELLGCLRVARTGGIVVLDDVFPNDLPAYPDGFHCPGPWLALEAARGDLAGLPVKSFEYNLIQRNPDNTWARFAVVVVGEKR